jgi:hypothetical protein
MADPARRLVSQALGECAAFTRRDRYIARIQAAAKELGIRIAEFDDYLRTPEGMAEQQRVEAEAQQRHQAMVNDGGMPDDPVGGSPLT